MTYPITNRTYFDTKEAAWTFAELIGNIKHGWIVSDYGVEEGRAAEPYYVETMNDPFATKDELMQKAGLLAK